jgi:hypothetical protein
MTIGFEVFRWTQCSAGKSEKASSSSRSSRALAVAFGHLGAALGGERLRGLPRVVLVLGVTDLRQHLLGERLERLGQGVEHVRGLAELRRGKTLTPTVHEYSSGPILGSPAAH